MAGAVALMPVYARDILETGPFTLGLLRSSPGIGAIIVAAGLSFYTLKNAGKVMLYAVALFGLSTILFGISNNIALSIIILCFVGGFDMLSVYIRDIIIQLGTEDKMRGRVNAVNMMFVGASNELGEFRAGMMASWIGTVPAVVIGGAGAIELVSCLMSLRCSVIPPTINYEEKDPDCNLNLVVNNSIEKKIKYAKFLCIN